MQYEFIDPAEVQESDIRSSTKQSVHTFHLGSGTKYSHWKLARPDGHLGHIAFGHLAEDGTAMMEQSQLVMREPRRRQLRFGGQHGQLEAALGHPIVYLLQGIGAEVNIWDARRGFGSVRIGIG